MSNSLTVQTGSCLVCQQFPGEQVDVMSVSRLTVLESYCSVLGHNCLVHI